MNRQKQIEAAGYSIGLILIIALSYGGFHLMREINYFFSYEEMVKRTICEMVSPENLKKPCKESEQ